jgi:hypothetical protein
MTADRVQGFARGRKDATRSQAPKNVGDPDSSLVLTYSDVAGACLSSYLACCLSPILVIAPIFSSFVSSG